MRIEILTALRPETRAVLRGLSGVRRTKTPDGPCWRARLGDADITLRQCGVGPERAEAAAERLASPPDVLVSVGLAGALRTGVAPGTLVVAERVLWEEPGGAYAVPPQLQRILRAATTGPTVEGALFSSPVVLATCAAKADAGRRLGAVAVEMESAPLARWALARGVGFLPIRTIFDPLELTLADLPPGLGSSWRARTRLATAPALWPKVGQLYAHATAATRVLTEVTRHVLRRVTQVA